MEPALRTQLQRRLENVADGPRDNWRFRAKELPPGEEGAFNSVAEQLRRALGQVYVEASPKPQAFSQLRGIPPSVAQGGGWRGQGDPHVACQRGRKRRCKALKLELVYFRRNRARMEYPRLRAQDLPIGWAWSRRRARRW